MDYSKIQLLKLKNNLSERRLAKMVGMSSSGLNNAMNRGTMTIAVLEKLCEIFDVQISYFFDDDTTTVLEKMPAYGKKCQSCLKKDGKIELLLSQLSEKEKLIKELYTELGRKTPGKDSKVA